MNADFAMDERFGTDRNARLVDPHAGAGERTYATFNHLTFLVTFLVAIPVVPALVMWLIKRNESPFLDDHGKEAVNFQISLLIYSIVGGILTLCGVGIVLVLGAVVLGVVGSILAAVAANKGEFYRYPATIRLIP